MTKRYILTTIGLFTLGTMIGNVINERRIEEFNASQPTSQMIMRPEQSAKIVTLANNIYDKVSELKTLESQPKVVETYLGVFSASAYCIENYHHICNDGTPYITASGGKPIPMQTVAVDPEIIPLGSKLRIQNRNIDIIVTANDKGGAIKGNKIDIVNMTHQAALEWGRQDVDVWIISEPVRDILTGSN